MADGQKTSKGKRSLQVAAALLVVGIVFFYALPKIADFSKVWSALQTMTPIEIGTLALAAGWNIVSYWLVMIASLPGSNVWQAMKVNLISTSVSNTVPGGSAIGIGVTYELYRAYNIPRAKVALSVLITGIWNNFVKLGMPIVALALLVATGKSSAGLVAGAGIGLLVLIVVIVGFAMALRSDVMARRIGEGLGRTVSRLRGLVRKDPVTGWGQAVAELRGNAIGLLRRRWLQLTTATVVSHLSLFMVLLLAARHVGISEAEISTVQLLAVFAFTRLLSAIPITPGGLGIVELGLIGGLVAAGGDRPSVVAAVLVFRVLTYVLPIPLGAFGYLQWLRRSRSRKERAAEKLVPAAAGKEAV